MAGAVIIWLYILRLPKLGYTEFLSSFEKYALENVSVTREKNHTFQYLKICLAFNAMEHTTLGKFQK
jgi:hypothetical protein